jgi:non-heme chloroperoxidase
MFTPNQITTREGDHLHFTDWGEGRPVLLMAGWAMTSALWSDLMLRLNDRGLRTIAYDRRGHGRSSDPGMVSFDALADDLHDVVEQLRLEDVTIVAHSAAASEAVRYISRHGEGRVARLILAGPSGPCLLPRPDNPWCLPSEAVDQLTRRLAEDLEAWADENAEPFAPGASRRTYDWLAGMVLGTSRRIAVDLFRANAEADMRAEYAALRLPVTIIHGDNDASAPIDLTGRRIEAITPGAELLVYEGAAHGLMLTHAARMAEDIASRVVGDVGRSVRAA